MSAPPLAALTGASGFLGRYVAEALAARGWRLRLLLRDGSSPPVLSAPIEIVRGDLADAASLGALVGGAQSVVHVAGLTRARGRAAFMAVNRDGSARLAEAAARAGVARLVLVSSLAARAPHLSHYAASKRAGEEAAAAALGGAAGLAVLRPAVIYGPGDREGGALYRLARSRLVPAPAGAPARLTMVHARDAAAAAAALCRRDAPAGRYEVTDSQAGGYEFRDILARIAALAGGQPRFVALPDAALLGAGLAADLWAALCGRAVMAGRGKMRELLHRDWRSDPARQPPPDLWSARVPLAAGLPPTVAWWAALGGARRPRTPQRGTVASWGAR